MSKRKKPFIPLNPPHVTMYVCGPTVYGEPHIGNLRTFTSGDLIRRWLEYRGYFVKYVMNITDIEDKTIRDSGNAGKTLKEFTDYYIKIFLESMDKLNNRRATAHPRATAYVPEMIEFIKQLEKKEIAYEASDGVYFDIDAFPDYGKLSSIDIEKTERTQRVAQDDYDKENAQDFALWKKSTEEEVERGIYYESPWGKGRPGWHIECSVMSKELLGDTVDIHAGGEDLAFPHHENEVAQTESLTGKKFVRYWLHMRHLMIDGGKMSKSLGNYVSFKEILDKHSATALRYFYISTQYRRPLNFTWQAIESAENTVERLENTLDLIDQGMNGPDDNLDYGEREDGLLKTVREEKSKFIEAMDNDLNTPVALGKIHAIRDAINEYLTLTPNKGVLSEASATYRELLKVLGLFEDRGIKSDETTEDLIKTIIELREKQRESKNYEIADQIREQLQEIGIELQDTSEGTSWKISR
jgi:cysteinyl-tRNA synthetase